MEWYTDVLKKYTVFTGRARRQEFWMFFLINFAISCVLMLIGNFIKPLGFLSTIYSLAVLIPSLALAFRRMHDIGKSGVWLLINLIPIVGWIWYVILAATEGNPGPNAYGPSPK